jgi:hypothetical protein
MEGGGGLGNVISKVTEFAAENPRLSLGALGAAGGYMVGDGTGALIGGAVGGFLPGRLGKSKSVGVLGSYSKPPQKGRIPFGQIMKNTMSQARIPAAVTVGAAAAAAPAALLAASAVSFGNRRYQMRLSGYGAPHNQGQGTFMPSGARGGAPAPSRQAARQSSMGGGGNYKMGVDGNLALAAHHGRRAM